MTDKSTVIGVDVGGTFTDLFFLNDSTGAIDVVKVPSTRGREADGFLDGLSRNQTDLAQVGTIVHGTTVGTNALLERKGAKCGLITSAGFRDVLEMRRRDRPATWGLRGAYTPVIPRDMRLEVPERILADGTIDTPLDHDALRAAAQTLLDQGAEAVVVAFVKERGRVSG